MSEFWYYAEGGQTHGPITFAELVDILSHLPNARSVPVWRTGLDDWARAESVRELAEQLFRPPPLRPQIEKDRPFKDIKPEPKGFGGWLLLVAYGQVLGFFSFSITMNEHFLLRDAALFLKFPATFYGAAAIDVATNILFIYAAVLFFRKSRNFPLVFMYQWMALIFKPLVAAAWVGVTLATYTGQTYSRFLWAEPEVMGPMIGGAFGAAIWIPYILRSKRVANTFVK